MVVEHLPLFPIPRVLVPGSSAGLPSTRWEVSPGAEVAAVFSPDGEVPPSAVVGTRSVVEAVRTLGPRMWLVRLRGERLVRILGAQRAGEDWTVAVAEIPEPGAHSATRVKETERVLYRYLARRAEAGEPIGRLPRLSRDPVHASHEVASHLRVSWPEVQDILEAGSAADRLRRAQAVLDREAELLRQLLGREGT